MWLVSKSSRNPDSRESRQTHASDKMRTIRFSRRDIGIELVVWSPINLDFKATSPWRSLSLTFLVQREEERQRYGFSRLKSRLISGNTIALVIIIIHADGADVALRSHYGSNDDLIGVV